MIVGYNKNSKRPCPGESTVTFSLTSMPGQGLNSPAPVIASWTPEVYAQMPYLDFLASEYWQWVRECLIELDGPRCALCDGELHPELHHKTYEHRGSEHLYLEDLIILCTACHKKLHGRWMWNRENEFYEAGRDTRRR